MNDLRLAQHTVQSDLIIKHPSYAFTKNDYGLMRLGKPIEFWQTIQPVKLYDRNDFLVNDTAIVTGFRRISVVSVLI